MEKNLINAASSRKSVLKYFMKYILIIELAAVFILFEILTKGLFLSLVNITNLLMQACVFSMLAIGMLYLLVAGNIDLSVGAGLGLLGTIGASFQAKMGIGTVPTILLMIVGGLLIGSWNGFFIAYMKIPAFIVTLATMLVFQGLNLFITGGYSIGPMRDTFCVFGKASLGTAASWIFIVIMVIFACLSMSINRKKQMKYGFRVRKLGFHALLMAAVCAGIVGVGYLLIAYRGIPYAVILLVVLAIVYTIIANSTPLGRHVYAIGGNRDAARLSGISVEKTIFISYLLSGLILGIASVTYLGRMRQATPQAGTDFEFSAITGCIVGGASTLGGVGTVWGAILGTVLVSSIDNGMSLLNLPSSLQYMVKGLVLLLAVLMDVLTKRNEKR